MVFPCPALTLIETQSQLSFSPCKSLENKDFSFPVSKLGYMGKMLACMKKKVRY